MACQLTSRDLLLLFWINSWGAVTLSQVAVWMNVDTSTAARRLRKLTEASLVRQIKLPLMAVTVIAVTADGCAVANDTLHPLSGIRVGTWRHDAWLVDNELQLEQRLGGWLETERRTRLRWQHEGREESHLPDAIIHRPAGHLIAVELELSAKAPARVQKIIDSYAASAEYATVLYLTDDPKLATYLTRFTHPFEFIKVRVVRSRAPQSDANRNQ